MRLQPSLINLPNLSSVLVTLIVCSLISVQLALATPPEASKIKKLPLQGGISLEVPRTPETVAHYLLTMRAIIQEYESVAMSTLLNNNKVNTDAQSINKARGLTLSLINRINSTIPPAELKNRHQQLATTMSALSHYLNNSDGLIGLDTLTQALPLVQNIQTTLDSYHQGVLNAIAFYGLSSQYDPFSGENEDAKNKLMGALGNMPGQLLQGQNSPGLNSSQASGGPAELLQGLGGLGNIDINSLSGPGGLGGLGNIDLKSLGQQNGTGLDPQSLNNLGKMLQQLQGQ